MILGYMAGAAAESPGSNPTRQGVTYALETVSSTCTARVPARCALMMLADLTAAPVTAAAPTADGVAVTVTLPLPGTGSGQWTVSFVVIHEADRFDPSIPARSYPLGFAADSWSGTVIIAPEAGTNFGLSGRYLYRFRLLRTDGTVVVPWFTDPFARATDDVGQLSAFGTADTIRDFTWGDDAWKVPGRGDLVLYELQVEEFNGTFAGGDRSHVVAEELLPAQRQAANAGELQLQMPIPPGILPADNAAYPRIMAAVVFPRGIAAAPATRCRGQAPGHPVG